MIPLCQLYDFLERLFDAQDLLSCRIEAWDISELSLKPLELIIDQRLDLSGIPVLNELNKAVSWGAVFFSPLDT